MRDGDGEGAEYFWVDVRGLRWILIWLDIGFILCWARVSPLAFAGRLKVTTEKAVGFYSVPYWDLNL